MPDNIFFSIFTVESFIPSVFLLLTALFLFTIPGKSKATFHIAMSLVIFSTIPICYLFASSIYHPAVGYNRWIAAYTSLPSSLHVVMVFLHFPSTINERRAKMVLIGGWVIVILGWIFFVYSTLDAGTRFLFSGHNYDMDAEKQQGIVAAAILLSVGTFIVVGLWRAFREKGKNRFLVLAILVSYMITTVAPGITNLWSRQGIITRGTFMYTYDLMVVVGLFVLIIVYINNVKEKSSFMIKIIGVTLVTFLLVLQFVANFLMEEKEADFDQQKYLNARLAVKTGERPEDLKYLISYNLEDKSFSSLVSLTEKAPGMDFHAYAGEYTNAFFMNSLESCTQAECVVTLLDNPILAGNPFFAAYADTYREFLRDLPAGDGKKTVNYFKERILEFQNTLRRYRILAESIQVEGYAQTLDKKLLAKEKKEIGHFQKRIQNHLEKKAGENPAITKTNVLQFFSLTQEPNRRFYREDPGTGAHYISYLVVDKEKRTITEAGFDYLSYRQFFHPPAKIILIMLVVVIFFILVGFRLFFYGALVKPLNGLLSGLKKVEDGDMDTHLKVQFEDEIGFITRSFNSMVRAIKAGELKLQRYAKGLEGKVKKRTAELSKTLDAVQRLKAQQDGDYFLTSLILKPLGPNRAKSDNVKTDFLVDQKKKFVFRKWESDIGGDICITDNVELSEKNFIVFVNGDAMGKSLQGAGGAMVLGAAFQSILERSRFSPDVKKQSPERWLKNAFSEMHTIFESFDGSMLMSAVIGLLDESTGLVYFINAEHPWVALYRDGRAEFIENDSIFRKLGSAILAGHIFVQTFQMKDGDVLFCASDGRDDLQIGTSEDGERIINEDETLFLRAIERAEGILDKTPQELQKLGELTDDLSILRIEYHRPESIQEPDAILKDYLEKARVAKKDKKIDDAIAILEKARSEQKKHPKLARELFKTYLATKAYDKAVRCGTIYANDNPSDTQSLFALSYAQRMTKDYKKAIDIGERVRLREPEMINNLVNLAECYYMDEEYQRVAKIAAEILTIDKKNNRALTILNKAKAKSISSKVEK